MTSACRMCHATRPDGSVPRVGQVGRDVAWFGDDDSGISRDHHLDGLLGVADGRGRAVLLVQVKGQHARRLAHLVVVLNAPEYVERRRFHLEVVSRLTV